ncbi:MAG: class I SAM-dependent rRNA methyltransferase [Chloroflexota bacterium]
MLVLDHLPTPSQRNIAMHITPSAERAVRDGHPWLFQNSLRKQSRDGKAGDLAVIFDKRDRFLAIGLYDPQSPIRVRVLHQGSSAKIDDAFFAEKIQQSYDKRAPIRASDTTGYRLIYGEGDGLSGLIIDCYANVLVIKIYTSAWFAHLKAIIEGLNVIFPDATLILRLSRLVQDDDTHGLVDGTVIQGDLSSPTVQFHEHGLTFQADIIEGHKTGFFFDQRDNRQRVRQLANGKTVLDVFSYNGGFSVNAAAGGATQVTSLDISSPALLDAVNNMDLNRHLPTVTDCQHETIVADAFEGLAELAQAGTTYDLVIVDPPTFASRQEQVAGAMIAYEKLVRLALDVLASSGTLVMASCSSRVPAEGFFALVHNTAIRAGRPLNEFARTQHALDHPITFPEGAYLKCLFATV